MPEGRVWTLNAGARGEGSPLDVASGMMPLAVGVAGYEQNWCSNCVTRAPSTKGKQAGTETGWSVRVGLGGKCAQCRHVPVSSSPGSLIQVGVVPFHEWAWDPTDSSLDGTSLTDG